MKQYAIIKIGAHQFKVSQDDELEIDKIEGEEGQKLVFEEVLLLVTDEEIKIGQPVIKGAKIQATLLEQKKGKKIRVATYKAKSRYRRVKGFRPHLSKIKIEKISLSKAKIKS